MAGIGYLVENDVELHPAGAARLLDHNALVVADLHLGCEAALEYQGMSLPRMQTRKLRKVVMGLLDTLKPDKLIVAGDLKHNFSRNLTQEWNDVADFIRLISAGVEVVVIRGNHDNYLGAILSEFGMRLGSELKLGRFRIIHGHAGSIDGPTIMGHIHPSMSLEDEVGARVRRPCFLHHSEGSMLVLPALSIVSPGLDIMRTTPSAAVSPPLAGLGLDGFAPIVFCNDRPLVFPNVGAVRSSGGPTGQA
ncbi:MAG: metallophosphoesterase [Thermoplasmata archaeon]|nr:metallophosphoesterase [Thermoplasmata archaeon]